MKMSDGGVLISSVTRLQRATGPNNRVIKPARLTKDPTNFYSTIENNRS